MAFEPGGESRGFKSGLASGGNEREAGENGGKISIEMTQNDIFCHSLLFYFIILPFILHVFTSVIYNGVCNNEIDFVERYIRGDSYDGSKRKTVP